MGLKGEALNLGNLVKRYGAVTAVSDVSFEVKAGEFVSILGPSGSGKTTLLMMIAGFETPTHGHIKVGGRDITALAPNRRNLGMVFQRYALFPHFTVAQNLAYPLKMRGFSKADIATRVNETLALIRMEEYAGRMPKQLSGGQQQRVALARAIIFEPPVLLMDEPLSALDKKLREALQLEIKGLQKRLGITIVYVTHDQEEALIMSDRVAVMSEGELVQLGQPRELYQRPASSFVADFVGKMNFLEGEYISGEPSSVSIRLSEEAVLTAKTANDETGRWQKGDLVKLAVRPEYLAISTTAQNSFSSIPATLETDLFVGSHHVYLVRIAGPNDQLIHVQAPASQGGQVFNAGDRLHLSVTGEVHLFPAPEREQ
jgi:mannopine transport system ATP-binding protein|tara:strand:+ start:17987 stop:19102 length:1116 start_codon:yes stop_codon:yes gene_type:complete